MAPKCALVIVNRLARRSAADLDEVVEVLRKEGIEAQLFVFENVSQIKPAVFRHAGRVDRIVVGGGDGTLNAAIEPVLAAGVPLGVMPLGTANDLARTLQIPADPGGAARVIAAGRIKKVDLGWVNNKYFFNVANIGLGVNVTHRLTRELKKKWGSLAYPLSILDAYRFTRPFWARISCDGRVHRVKTIQIAVGNGRHYGGGMVVRHDASIDDHLLNLYSIEPLPMWRLLRSAPSIIRGTMAQGELVRLMDGRRIRVVTARPMPIDTDGEVTAWTPALFRVEKERLPVFVP